MSLLSKATKPFTTQWRRTLIYGPPGVGKSTKAATYPSPYAIDTEGGMAGLNVMKLPTCTAWDEADAMNAPLPAGATEHTALIPILFALCNEQHDFQTVILDSVDWAERLCHAAVCRAGGKKSIKDFGWGDGYTFALDRWQTVLNCFTDLHVNKKMDIVLIAHAERKKVNDPMADPYDEWGPRVHKDLMAVLVEWCEEVLFLNYKTYTVTVEANGREMTRPTGGSDRVIYTTKSAGFVAKNRLGLPPELPLDGVAYQKVVAQRVDEINKRGTVTNG